MEEAALSHPNVELMESGNIYFFYRTNGAKQTRMTMDAVQQFYVILKPKTRSKFRVLSLVRKTGAGEEACRQPIWGRVEAVEYLQAPMNNAWQQSLLFPEDEQPISLPDALPMARGTYQFVRQKDVVHLSYTVDANNQSISFNDRFSFSVCGGYAIQIKNPDTHMALSPNPNCTRKVRYPEHLKQRFKHRPFISKEAHEYLDYAGTELLMIVTQQKRCGRDSCAIGPQMP